MNKIVFVFDGTDMRGFAISSMTILPRVGDNCQIKNHAYKVFGITFDYDQNEIRIHITK